MGTNSKQGGAGKSAAEAREDRLKAALKANLGRRKAQARIRQAEDAPTDDEKAGKPAD